MRSPSRLLVLPVVAYFATASRWVLGGDNAEFVALFADGGVAHPSGYPVYTLYLRVMHGLLFWLPAPLGASLATALLAALTIAALHRACLGFGASSDAALFAAALYAVGPLPWSLATHAEVFTPNALFAAVLMVLCAPDVTRHGTRQSALLGLVAGLALGNHLTIVFVAPLGLVGLFTAVSRSPSRSRAFAMALLGLLLGLSSYLSLSYASLHAHGRWVWGDPGTATGLLHHVLRSDYGTTRLSSGSAPVRPLVQFSAFVIAFGTQWLFAPALLGLVCLARDLRSALRFNRTDSSVRSGALALSVILAGPLFVSRFNIAPTGIGALIVSRFYLLPMVLFAPFIARGADLVAPRVRPVIARAAMTALVLASFAYTLPSVLDEHRPTLEHYALDVLSLVPPRSIVLVSGDHRTFGLIYAQRALGVRRDVILVAPRLLLVDGNRSRYARALGISLPPPLRRSVDMPDVVNRLLATGRPLFATDSITDSLFSHFSVYPVGPLIRVLPHDAPTPPPEALERLNLEVLRHSRLTLSHRTSTGWFSLIYADWARPWNSLGLAYDQLRQPERAAAARARERLILGPVP